MGDAVSGVRAVLFDVDGTLYSQAPVRAAMALELGASTLLRPAATIEAIRVLKSFRRTRERLRDRGTQADLKVGLYPRPSSESVPSLNRP